MGQKSGPYTATFNDLYVYYLYPYLQNFGSIGPLIIASKMDS
jgi:hypothetical protein